MYITCTYVCTPEAMTVNERAAEGRSVSTIECDVIAVSATTSSAGKMRWSLSGCSRSRSPAKSSSTVTPAFHVGSSTLISHVLVQPFSGSGSGERTYVW